MSVTVRDPIHQFTEKMLTMTRTSLVMHDFCGVILMKCTSVNPKFLVQLESFLKKTESALSTVCYFDDRTRVLAVVLEGQKLAGTHYLSLVCKDFLERHRLLAGQVIVASFPEFGEPTELYLMQLFQAAAAADGEERSIRLFVEPSEKDSVSSILVADAEEMNRSFIKHRLELKGYKVHEAQDGSEALDKYAKYAPDLVITELNLPVLDGYQLISKIKDERPDEGKVIVLTNKHVTQHMNRAFELGASDYVTKPFSFSELEWRIKRLQFS